MQPAELEARGIRRSFGPLKVLRGIDLAVARGEVLAILGPNGAGKSTLLRTLAGLVRPSAGDVLVRGRPLRGDHDARRAIGLLSHQSFLYDDLTLLENLRFAARLYGLADADRLGREALEQVGLSARAGDRPRQLSRGMQQRAAIARALLHQPSVLLLDEPFTGLDAAAAVRLRSVIREEAARGRAVVLVTHHAGEAWDAVTRLGVLINGRWALLEDRGSDSEMFGRRYAELIRG